MKKAPNLSNILFESRENTEDFRGPKELWEAKTPDITETWTPTKSYCNSGSFSFQNHVISPQYQPLHKSGSTKSYEEAAYVDASANLNKQTNKLSNQQFVPASRVIWKAIEIPSSDDATSVRTGSGMAPASFWTSPSGSSTSLFQRNSKQRSTLHGLPSHQSGDKSKKFVPENKKSAFLRNTRLTSSTGKNQRKTSEIFIKSGRICENEEFSKQRKSSFSIRSIRKKMSKDVTGSGEIKKSESSTGSGEIKKSESSTGLLLPLDCDYLTCEEMSGKRKSRSFSKADIYMFEKKKEMNLNLFVEDNILRRKSIESRSPGSRRRSNSQQFGATDNSDLLRRLSPDRRKSPKASQENLSDNKISSDTSTSMTSTDGVTSSPFARNFLRKSHFDAINSNEVAGSDEKDKTKGNRFSPRRSLRKLKPRKSNGATGPVGEAPR